MKALTHDEVLKVLKAADDKRNVAMILLGYRHGMRASEVCGLELKDVDLKNGEITIRRLKGSLKTTQPLADVAAESTAPSSIGCLPTLRSVLACRRISGTPTA